MFNSKKSEPVDQFSTERQAITAATAELNRLDAAVTAASSELNSAEIALRQAADPVAALDLSDEEKRGAQQRFLEARKAYAKASADRAAFPETRESLATRLKSLAEQENEARLARVQATFKDHLSKLARLGLELETENQHILKLARQNPDANLPDHSVCFPVGVFDLGEATPHGGEAALVRTIFRNHVLVGIAAECPDALPPDITQPILTKLSADRERGAPRWYALPTNRWDIYPAKRRS